METPGDTTDDVPVQNETENCIETAGDSTDDIPVQNEAENHMNTSRTTRRVWHWNRIYARGELRPKQIRYTREEKFFCSCPKILQVRISSNYTSLTK